MEGNLLLNDLSVDCRLWTVDFLKNAIFIYYSPLTIHVMEISRIIDQLRDAYEGEPWFGRPVKQILAEVDESIAFESHKGSKAYWNCCGT